MITKAPACRTVCNGKPGDVMEQLIAAFKKLRVQGVSEEQALLICHDPNKLVDLLPSSSFGGFHGAAEALVSSGCSECAVNHAYAEGIHLKLA